MIYSFLNPYSYILARKRINLFNKFSGIFIDGKMLCVFFKIFTSIKPERISFDMTSLAPDVFSFSEKKGLSLFLIGSKHDEIDLAVIQFIKAYPKLKIIGFRDGYIRGVETKVYSEINELSPDIVVCGMGTPLQEEFLLGLQLSGWKGVGYTCGGFFHQTAAGIDYYPNWINKFNLRWLYRIYDEPKLWSRYFIQYPKFSFLFLYDVLFNRWWDGLILERKVDYMCDDSNYKE